MNWREKFKIDNLDLKSDSEEEMQIDEKPQKKQRKPRQPAKEKKKEAPKKRRAPPANEYVEKHTQEESSYMGIPEEDPPHVRPSFDQKKAIQTPQGRLLLDKRKSVSDIDPTNISSQQFDSSWEQFVARKFAPVDKGIQGNYPQFQPNPVFSNPFTKPPQQTEAIKKKGIFDLFG